MRLSQVQQRGILDSLPASRKIAVKKYCRTCQQQGDGVTDILKKIGNFLGPIAKDVGPKVLKEFIIPLLLKKAKEHYGVGLSPAGSGSPWIAHCKKVAKEQNLTYKDAMKVASKTYKK